MRFASPCLWAGLIVLLWAASAPAVHDPAETTVPAAAGTVLPDVVLDQPSRECGIAPVCHPDRDLHLSELPGRWLLVECFSMYCPHCQAEAGKVNELAKMVAAAAGTAEAPAGGLTLVGLGADNSRFEVDYFQQHYAVPFVLFPDPGMAFYDALGSPGTPSFVLVEKIAGGLVLRGLHVGPFSRPADLLDELFGRPAAREVCP